MSLSQEKPVALTAQLVCMLAQQAFHDIVDQTFINDEGEPYKVGDGDVGEQAESIAQQFEQLLYQALGVPMGAQTESGYYLLPSLPPSQWRSHGVSGS